MPEGTVEWGTLRQAFTEGKTAMMWHTTGNLTAVKDSAKFPFGVAMLPAKKQPGSPTGGGNFYISKKASPAPTGLMIWSAGTGAGRVKSDTPSRPSHSARLAEWITTA